MCITCGKLLPEIHFFHRSKIFPQNRLSFPQVFNKIKSYEDDFSLHSLIRRFTTDEKEASNLTRSSIF